MMKEIHSGQDQPGIFGKVVAFLLMIEFKKRGLPHAHILLILQTTDQFKSAEDIDKVISAKSPLDPE